jgi:protein ImuA
MNNIVSDSAWQASMSSMAEYADTRQASVYDILRHHLPGDHLHEVYAASPSDAACAVGFARMLLSLLSVHNDAGSILLASNSSKNADGERKQNRGPCFWVTPARRAGQPALHALGLTEMGFGTGDCYQVHAATPLVALRAAADIVRCGGIGAVLLMVTGNPAILDLTATRRLALAAEKNATPVILLRIEARQMPSAAYSRWQIKSAASRPLPADAPGLPTFDVELLRHRKFMGGGTVRLEWDPYDRTIRQTALSAAENDRQQTRQTSPHDDPRTKIPSNISALPVRQPYGALRKSAA